MFDVSIVVAASSEDALAYVSSICVAASPLDHLRHGASHSQLSIANLQGSNATCRTHQAEHKARVFAEVAHFSFSRHVAGVCFWRNLAEDAKRNQDQNGGTVNIQLTTHGTRSHSFNHALRPSLLSTVHAQDPGLANFIANPEGDLHFVLSVGMFDDAPMWVMDPVPRSQRLEGSPIEGRQKLDAFGRGAIIDARLSAHHQSMCIRDELLKRMAMW